MTGNQTENKTVVVDKKPDNETNNKTMKTVKKKKKIKCYQCKKKLILIQQIKCQCNQYFCPSHMNRHSHNCPCNIKEETRKQIEQNNPKMKPCIIDKI